jgi:UDP-N-acetylmuramoyl-tripeptide--D-alanyl-D-alanine ligase
MKQKLLNLIYVFLKYCAKKYIAKHKPKVIGITGSVGKTSARMIIAQVLRQVQSEKVISTSPKNFNSELWIIFSIFEIIEYTPNIKSLLKNILIVLTKLFTAKKPYDILVLEYGIDAPGDMDYLTSIVKPDYGVFTKLDFVHAQFFNNKEEIWEEKRILLDRTKQKVYLGNHDEYLKSIFDEFLQHKQFFPEVLTPHFHKENNIITSEFNFEDKKIRANIFGQENLEYIALACQLASDMWMNISEDNYEFNLENQAGRFNILEWIKGNILIDSSYNAAPASMIKMIQNTFELQKSLFSDHKVFLVLGDMRELGEISPTKHLELNDYIIEADGIYCIWEEIMPLHEAITVQSFEWELNLFKKSNEAWKSLEKYLENTEEKYVILFKWSQNTIFTEEALKEVLLNKSDAENLVRQSKDWLEKKNKFFTN